MSEVCILELYNLLVILFFLSDKAKMSKSNRSVTEGAKASRLQRNKMVRLLFLYYMCVPRSTSALYCVYNISVAFGLAINTVVVCCR